MGVYVYKVTAKVKTLADGSKANVAVFAYKPASGWNHSDERLNRAMAKDAGVPQAERFAAQKSKNWMGRAVLGESGEIAVPVTVGSFEDNWFSNEAAKLRS